MLKVDCSGACREIFQFLVGGFKVIRATDVKSNNSNRQPGGGGEAAGAGRQQWHPEGAPRARAATELV